MNEQPLKKSENDDEIIFNNDLLKIIGLEKTGYLSYLYQESESEEIPFHISQEEIKTNIGISAAKQTRFIKFFTRLGILKVEKIGLPAKNYYTINQNDIQKFIIANRE